MALCIPFTIEILLRIKKMGAKYMYMYTGIKIIVFVDSFCFAFLFYAFLCLSFCTTAPKSLNFI